ncbi:glycoside hydrolase family 13 protein [Silvibacterium acidisoli]|uniref:glycoside hydrolase family 13 protein n=1 Tax=Acidobacteriaceae bacterium ZG23-2 TaxID=2883246 RepID=UPI00406C5161
MLKHGIAAALLALAPALASAQTAMKNVDAEGHPWWRHAVFYEVYPRSFADSNNDGIGDLNGIASKTGYLKALGVDAIWITPCFPSPQKDFGYDVADYQNIDPMYGTLADFDRLSAQAKQDHIRIILDFVINHTSDQNKWFLESRSSKTSPYRNWYVWHDAKPGGQPPNNWESDFGGPAWTFDQKTGQYYYHYFEAAQPDLNWRNPAVEKAMFDATRFWYRRGVSGFRLDAVDTLFEDPQLRDNPFKTNSDGTKEMINKYNDKLPQNHEVLRRLRKVADESNAVLIGETWTENINQLHEYYGPHDDEIQMPMDFLFTTINVLSASKFRTQINQAESSGEWPVWVITNHDMTRSYNRYGDGKHNDEIAKLMAGMYLTLRGTPIMYYGEELGMENNDPKRKEDVLDPLGKNNWPQNKGRDGERTPMQWNTSANAGFTTGKPWLPVPASYKTHNVETELKDPNSILNFYKRLLALRHTNEALIEGDFTSLNNSDPNVLAYLRSYKGKSVLVALNMSASPQKVDLDLSKQGESMRHLNTLLATPSAARNVSAKGMTLAPFAVYIAETGK